MVTGHEDPGKPDGRVDWECLAAAVDTIVVLMGTAALPEIARRAVHLSPCTIVIGEVVRLRPTAQRAEGKRGGRFSRIAAAPSRTSASMNVSISSAMD